MLQWLQSHQFEVVFVVVVWAFGRQCTMWNNELAAIRSALEAIQAATEDLSLRARNADFMRSLASSKEAAED